MFSINEVICISFSVFSDGGFQFSRHDLTLMIINRQTYKQQARFLLMRGVCVIECGKWVILDEGEIGGARFSEIKWEILLREMD